MARTQWLWLVVGLGLGCADRGAIVRPPPTPTTPVVGAVGPATDEAPATSELVPVTAADPILGPKTARVTVVVFGDFQCPFTARVQPTLHQLRDRYGDSLRVVWKDLPLDFHKEAKPAAIAAEVARLAKGDAAFWAMSARIFEGQTQLSQQAYLRWLAEVGVDEAQYGALAGEAQANVERDLQLSKQLGINGTPNFLIDGERLTGAQPIEKFTAVVDAHLEKARSLAAQGTPERDVYARLVGHYYRQEAAPEPKAGDDAPEEDTSIWKAEIGASPARGKATAKVTLVVFSDFQCPFCKRLEPTLAQLESKFGDDLRIVWKNQPLPFHKRAMPAAIAAWEVYKQKGAAGFFAMRDALFASQPKLEDEDLEAAAATIPGVDVAKVMKAVATEKWRAEIENDVEQAERLSVSGTPHSFVNGRRVSGAQPYDKFEQIVVEERAKADAKLAAGTKPANLYAEIIKDGKGGLLAPLAIPPYAPTRGGKNAKVVIHVFSDFQCPFCRRAAIPTPKADGTIDPNAAGLHASILKYKDKIRVVWRNFPLSFHTRARPAANFALEAYAQKGATTFWNVHDALFGAPNLDDATLEAIAAQHGIDWTKAKAAIDSDKYAAQIDQDLKDGAAAGVTGTPAFFVNGRSLVGAQPADAFFKVIDKALAEAK